MILITGASGNNGIELAKALAQRGTPFRAMVRTLKSGDKLKSVPRVELVTGGVFG
jgi:uncharacterized protein YbjT (DUF2867 family)